MPTELHTLALAVPEMQQQALRLRAARLLLSADRNTAQPLSLVAERMGFIQRRDHCQLMSAVEEEAGDASWLLLALPHIGSLRGMAADRLRTCELRFTRPHEVSLWPGGCRCLEGAASA